MKNIRMVSAMLCLTIFALVTIGCQHVDDTNEPTCPINNNVITEVPYEINDSHDDTPLYNTIEPELEYSTPWEWWESRANESHYHSFGITLDDWWDIHGNSVVVFPEEGFPSQIVFTMEPNTYSAYPKFVQARMSFNPARQYGYYIVIPAEWDPRDWFIAQLIDDTWHQLRVWDYHMYGSMIGRLQAVVDDNFYYDLIFHTYRLYRGEGFAPGVYRLVGRKDLQWTRELAFDISMDWESEWQWQGMIWAEFIVEDE